MTDQTAARTPPSTAATLPLPSTTESTQRRRPRWRRYISSLPERGARALAAVLGGVLYEISQVALPAFVRRSKLYDATIARMLRLIVELLGGVEGVYRAEAIPARDLLARKTAGNVVELASILAVGWSPLWLLAAAADLTGGSKVYLRALEAELKRAGLLPEASDVSSVEQLLTRVEATSGVLADTIDIPPFRPADLRASWDLLRRQGAAVPSGGSLAALAADLHRVAGQQGRSIGELSGALGLGAARAGAQLGSVYVVDYYRQALQTIADEGLEAYLRRASRPYLQRAGGHLDPARATYTERLIVRLRRLAHRVGRHWRRFRART
jgi:hypothetical protein